MRVVYVVGAGRSGSTVLDCLLGNHPDVVGVGELLHLAAKGWVGEEVCSCGAVSDKCAFWSSVRTDWEGRTEGAAVSELARLTAFFDHVRFPRIWRSHRFARYGELTVALYEAISAVSGRSLVVDSTKLPARAVSLSRLPKLDVHFVHLIRDPRAVIWSLKKRYDKNPAGGIQTAVEPRSAMRSAAFWAATNLQAEVLRRRWPSDRWTTVRYEDLCADVSGQCDRLGSRIGMDLAAVAARASAGEALHMDHKIAGNRTRMAKMVLRGDEEWRERLPAADRRLIKLLLAPLLRRYQYLDR